MTTTSFDETLLNEEGITEEGIGEEESPAEETGSKLLTPEGIIMLSIAGMFDLAGWLCIAFYALFGFGAIAGRIVSVSGFAAIGAWQFFRSGSLPTKKGPGPEEGLAGALAKKFLKKHWKKLVAEALPGVGDFFPSFVWIVYSELKD